MTKNMGLCFQDACIQLGCIKLGLVNYNSIPPFTKYALSVTSQMFSIGGITGSRLRWSILI